jgi:hypothetical protein
VPDGDVGSPSEPAVEWAEHLRRAWAEVVRGLGSGGCPLEQVLALRDRADVGTMHLRAVLEALPGARRIDTRRRLAELGLAERTPLCELEDVAVASVLETFGSGGR